MFKHENGGTPYTVKAARTVWSGGKDGDNLKTLPIAIHFDVEHRKKFK